MMHLQRQHRTRIHDKALHLEPVTAIDTVIASPRPINLAMQTGLVAIGLFQTCHQFLHLLDTVSRCHQNGILGLDHDVILESQRADQSVIGVHIAVCTILEHYVAMSDIVVFVLLAGFV